MPYLIDGHNLIGAVPDIRLDEPDDEDRLIERLIAFCRKTGKQAEVYFDRAAPGRAGRFRHGPVTAVFVAAGDTADRAIRRRLGQLGRSAADWTVVSSDREVQTSARTARAGIQTTQAFAGLLQAGGPGVETEKGAALSPGEIDDWLRMFGEEEEGKKAG